MFIKAFGGYLLLCNTFWLIIKLHRSENDVSRVSYFILIDYKETINAKVPFE